jgi:hypothetical protein
VDIVAIFQREKERVSEWGEGEKEEREGRMEERPPSTTTGGERGGEQRTRRAEYEVKDLFANTRVEGRALCQREHQQIPEESVRNQR